MSELRNDASINLCFFIKTIQHIDDYRKISNKSASKFQNLNVSHLALQVSLLILLKPGVKLRMKM